MDFKEIKKLAINLYRQGTQEQEIQKLCQIPISKELIKSWIQEDEEFEKLKTLFKLVKKLKKVKSITINSENRDEIIAQLQEISFKILDIEPDNEIAMNELIRCYTMQKQFDIARTYGNKALQVNPNNKYILYNMAKLELEAHDFEKAELYNDRLIQIEKDNKPGNMQRRLIQERKTNYSQKAEPIIEEKITKDNKTLEEQQKEFAIQQMEKEKYNEQNQEDYMKTIAKMFYDGKINKNNLDIIRQELYRYPNKIKSALFLSELYSFVMQSEERGIEELDNIIDSVNSLSSKEFKVIDERIREFRKRISYRKEFEENRIQEEHRKKELIKEQRNYSKYIIKKLKNGQIEIQEIPQIVEKLEQYPDRSRAVFLIMKLYETFYGRKEALSFLVKYSSIANLTETEKENIAKLKAQLKENLPKRKRKNITKRLKRQDSKKYTKQINKSVIIRLLLTGNSVKEINEELSSKGESISLKTITKIKQHLVETNEEQKRQYEEDLELARLFFHDNYSVSEVYRLLSYNVGRSKLTQMKKNLELEIYK